MLLNKVYILTSTNFLLRFYNSSTKFLPKKHLPILQRHKYYSMMYASSDHELDVSGEQSYTQAVFVHIFQSFPCAFSRAVAWKRRVWQGIFRAAFTRAVALQPRTLPRAWWRWASCVGLSVLLLFLLCRPCLVIDCLSSFVWFRCVRLCVLVRSGFVWFLFACLNSVRLMGVSVEKKYAACNTSTSQKKNVE